jgi:hypothetical protein
MTMIIDSSDLHDVAIMEDDKAKVPVPPNNDFYGGVCVWMEFREAYSFLNFPFTCVI